MAKIIITVDTEKSVEVKALNSFMAVLGGAEAPAPAAKKTAKKPKQKPPIKEEPEQESTEGSKQESTESPAEVIELPDLQDLVKSKSKDHREALVAELKKICPEGTSRPGVAVFYQSATPVQITAFETFVKSL